MGTPEDLEAFLARPESRIAAGVFESAAPATGSARPSGRGGAPSR